MNKLVSIVVLIYNSQDFIKETLKSIVEQSYKEIEILLCDDCSNDNSLIIAEEFLKSVKFNSFKIIKNEVNLGIPKNCNNGVEAARGEYIKLIAADDILIKDCIKSNVEFMEKNKNNIQYSRLINFHVENGEIIESKSNFVFDKKINNLTAEQQFDKMIFENFIPAPTVFFRKNVFEKYGMFNEKYKLMEDYPMWVKVLYNNEKIYFLDEVTILYRIHNASLSNSNEKHVNIGMFNCYKEYIATEFIEYLLNKRKYMHIYHKKIEILKMQKIVDRGNVKGVSEKGVKWYNLLDPLWFINKIKYKH